MEASGQDLKVIAAELRTLPDRGDSIGERVESAGRLLLAAMNAGAFSGPSYAAFRPLVRQRAEQRKVNGFISAWAEPVWYLNGKPKDPPDLEATFPRD